MVVSLPPSNYNNMKKVVLFSVGSLLLWACNNTQNATADENASVNPEMAQIDQSKPEGDYYGDTITSEGAVSTERLMAMLDEQDSVAVKVKGTANSSCEKMGCWMRMDAGNGEEMMVKFKDYGFFVPKDLNGETVIIDGYAKREVTLVDELKHYAEDAGKSQAEIDAITEPEQTISYLASGVIIKK